MSALEKANRDIGAGDPQQFGKLLSSSMRERSGQSAGTNEGAAKIWLGFGNQWHHRAKKIAADKISGRSRNILAAMLAPFE